MWKKIDEVAEGRDMFRPLEYWNALNEVINRDPQDSVALRLRGYLGHLEEPEGSLNDLNRAINLNPKDSSSYLKRGKFFWDWDRYEEALLDLNISIELNPVNKLAYQYRGIVYWTLNKNTPALQDFNQGLEINPDDPSLLIYRGSLLTELERYEEALADYNHVISLPQKRRWTIDFKEVIFDRGKIHMRLKQKDKALSDFKWATKIDPSYPEPFYYCGVIYATLEQFNDAAKNLENALKLGLSDKNKLDAESLLKEIKENNINSIIREALTLSDNNKEDLSLELLAKHIKEEPNNVSLLLVESHVLSKKGLYERAIDNCNKVLSIVPDSPRALYGRSLFNAKIGNLDAVFMDLKKAIELNPEFKKHAVEDQDFDKIRDMKEFWELIA
ncbi:MAG: hypothetical protein JSV09_10225 [Thermoplasmata archaeon]|nr:MAG: hypothetical protein JSV09_10225 [Thermoplasmata archaeon]